MDLKTVQQDFEASSQALAGILERLPEAHLENRIEDENYSVGQLFLSLIDLTLNRQLPTVMSCLEQPDLNAEGELSTMGEQLLHNNTFPESGLGQQMEQIRQPRSKAELKDGLQRVQELFQQVVTLVKDKSQTGKCEHAILGYLTAPQQLQLIAMYWRYYTLEHPKVGAQVTREE